MAKKDMNKDVGEVFQSVVESVKQKKEETEEKGIRKVLSSVVRQKGDKKIKRKWRQIEKGCFMLVGALVVGYASNALFITKVDERMSQTETAYQESQFERVEVQSLLDNQEATKEHIQEMETQLEAVGLKYPNYRTENEILIVLNELFAPRGVSVSSIAVTPSSQVQKGEIGALISQKGLTDYVDDAGYFGTAAVLEETAAADTQTETSEEGARETKFDVTEATFSVEGIDRAKALELAETINSSTRILIPKSLSIIGNADGTEYSFQGTLMFYSYRVNDTESLV